MNTVRLLAVGWWLQLKMRSRSAFEGVLGMLWPLFFATTIFLMYRQTASGSALIGAAVGASAMGVWSATSTTASSALQTERRQGTLELLVAAPARLPLLVLPIALSMATIGLYSLVATLLWGRLAFGIPISFHDPFGFVCAVLAIVIAIALIGFLEAIMMVATGPPGPSAPPWSCRSGCCAGSWCRCRPCPPGCARCPGPCRRPGGSTRCGRRRWAVRPGWTSCCAWLWAPDTP